MLLFFYFFILASPFRGTTVTPTVQAMHVTASASISPDPYHPTPHVQLHYIHKLRLRSSSFFPSYLASPYLTATIPPFYKPFYPCLSKLLNLSCLSDVLNSNRV